MINEQILDASKRERTRFVYVSMTIGAKEKRTDRYEHLLMNSEVFKQRMSILF
jgi:hypothetical protein